jgi:hypothetical protein
MSRGTWLHSAAQAAEAEAVFTKVLLEIRRMMESLISFSITELATYPRIFFALSSQVAIVFLKYA